MTTYRVTLANGEQTDVESDLPIAEFAKGYSLTADILPLPAPEKEVEAPVAKTRKTSK